MLKCAAADPANKQRHASITPIFRRTYTSRAVSAICWLFSSSYDFAIRHTRDAWGRESVLPRRCLSLITWLAVLGAEPAKPAIEGDLLGEMKGHTNRAMHVVFSPDGRYVL